MGCRVQQPMSSERFAQDVQCDIPFKVSAMNSVPNHDGVYSSRCENQVDLLLNVAGAMRYHQYDELLRGTDENLALRHPLGESARVLGIFGNEPHMLCSHETYQFNDYSKFETAVDESYRAEIRANRFPKDLQAAYDLGKRLVEKAKE